VLRRTIDKWLAAGVFEEGSVRHPDEGTPQGGVISPLLANLYLHEVVDVWFEDVVRLRMKGRAFLVRYADDLVIVLAREDDARRVMAVLPKRFGKYGLTLHPEKTRLVRFLRPPLLAGPKGDGEARQPGTFDLLGFTHLWRRTRRGTWAIQRKTAKGRFTRALRRVRQWCRENRHRPVAQQHEGLLERLQGHYSYYGITWNSGMLKKFRMQVLGTWRKWLNRRSQRSRMKWPKFRRLLGRYPIPEAIAVHSVYRSQRTRGPKSRMR
jgi:hypothetical protein